MERHEDVVFGLEVVVEGGLGDAQLFGDFAQARAVEALLDEEVEGDVEDAVAGALGRGGCGGCRDRCGVGLGGLGRRIVVLGRLLGGFVRAPDR